jgi:hypothetical protein
MPKRTYTLENVQKLGEHLAKLPPKPRAPKTDNLGAADLVRTIRKEIRTAMGRGYTMEDIVSAAKSMGFDLSTPTLKKYLGSAARKPRVTRKKEEPKSTPAPATPTKRQPSEKPGAGVPPVQMPKADEL